MTSPQPKERIGVIGGGLGGLAAATTLAARGYDVVLFERNSWLGGKAAELNVDGYRFDMGPTILTMPSVLEKLFAEAGLSLQSRLDLIRLDPQWRCFFPDRPALDLVEDIEEMASRCEAFSPGLGKGYRDFMAFSGRMKTLSDRIFFWRPVESLRDMFKQKVLSPGELLVELVRMRQGWSVAGTVRKHVPEPHVAQILDHFTQYVGSSPEAAPAVLCGIARMQTDEGIWYPRGGTRAVPVALEQLARELGVEIRTGAGVSKILLDSRGKVRGIATEDGVEEPLGAVVSNMDSVRTYRELVGGKPAAQFNRRRTYEPACSGVVLYLGLNRRYDQLLHHNFVFSENAHAEFASIYREGVPTPDPTCYVCAPACTEPEVAPPGGEALYVLVHTPYMRSEHDWNAMYPKYREVILDKLEHTAGLTGIRDSIQVERFLTPADIHRRYSVLQGAIYGLASHGRFFGAFKPSNRSANVPGLYLAGGAAHPGPGMPMVLMSGWIAADALDRDGLISRRNNPIAATA